MQIHLTHYIDAGHRVVGHEEGRGKCARLHGHTYRFEVTVKSPVLLPIGFVVDFAQIKKILDEWDHRLILWIDDPLWGPKDNPNKREQLLGANGCVCVSFNPTAENMAHDRATVIFGEVIREHMVHGYGGEGVSVEVEVFETPKSSAKVRIT